GVAGQVSNAITKFAGLSSLTIDPTLGGNLQNPGARLAVQKRVTKNLLLTISTDVASTEDAIVQVQYQITPKVSVNAVRNEYGSYGINIKFHKNF
ncbi:MAG: translocation/assembly module TamB domain-containing protein, partial [Terriglobia bacterium]